MNTSQRRDNQSICDAIAQLQIDLETTIKQIFEQVGSKIEPEQRTEVETKIAGTNQLLEHFKHQYSCPSIIL